MFDAFTQGIAQADCPAANSSAPPRSIPRGQSFPDSNKRMDCGQPHHLQRSALVTNAARELFAQQPALSLRCSALTPTYAWPPAAWTWRSPPLRHLRRLHRRPLPYWKTAASTACANLISPSASPALQLLEGVRKMKDACPRPRQRPHGITPGDCTALRS